MDLTFRHAELSSQHLLRDDVRFEPPTDLADFKFAELRVSVPNAGSRCPQPVRSPILSLHVGSVHCGSSIEQMGRIAARRVIASVAYERSGVVPVMKRERNAVRIPLAVWPAMACREDVELTVAARHAVAFPRPTLIASSEAHERPEFRRLRRLDQPDNSFAHTTGIYHTRRLHTREEGL